MASPLEAQLDIMWYTIGVLTMADGTYLTGVRQCNAANSTMDSGTKNAGTVTLGEPGAGIIWLTMQFCGASRVTAICYCIWNYPTVH